MTNRNRGQNQAKTRFISIFIITKECSYANRRRISGAAGTSDIFETWIMVLIVPVNARPQKREFSTRKPYAIAETKNFVDIGRLSLYFCARSEIRIPVPRHTVRRAAQARWFYTGMLLAYVTWSLFRYFFCRNTVQLCGSQSSLEHCFVLFFVVIWIILIIMERVWK